MKFIPLKSSPNTGDYDKKLHAHIKMVQRKIVIGFSLGLLNWFCCEWFYNVFYWVFNYPCCLVNRMA